MPNVFIAGYWGNDSEMNYKNLKLLKNHVNFIIRNDLKLKTDEVILYSNSSMWANNVPITLFLKNPRDWKGLHVFRVEEGTKDYETWLHSIYLTNQRLKNTKPKHLPVIKDGSILNVFNKKLKEISTAKQFTCENFIDCNIKMFNESTENDKLILINFRDIHKQTKLSLFKGEIIEVDFDNLI